MADSSNVQPSVSYAVINFTLDSFLSHATCQHLKIDYFTLSTAWYML